MLQEDQPRREPFLLVRFFSESKRGGPVKESTLEFWENHINRFVVPALGPYWIDCLDTATVEKTREKWKALGLTAPSVNKVLTTLSAIFDKQIALRTVRFNPVTLAERMAIGSNEVGDNDEIDIDSVEVRPDEVYSPEQLLKLIQSAEPGFDQTILTTFALTMVRHGEGLGLMWRDVDFDTKETGAIGLADTASRVRAASRFFGFRSQSIPCARFGFRMNCAWR